MSGDQHWTTTPTLSDVVVGEANRAAYDACRTLCGDPRSPRGLLVLEGPTGTGKTFLLAAVAGELRRLGQGLIVTFRGADLSDDVVASAASWMLGRPPRALLIDEVDALPGPLLQLVSPLGVLLDRLCLQGTGVAMACREWTPELDILLSLPTASGSPATRTRCLPVNLELRRAIVARMAETTGAEAEADAVDLLARTCLPDAHQLVALAGTTLARARLKGLPVTVESVASALGHHGAQRGSGGGTTVRARPGRPVQPLAEHLCAVPTTMPEPGLFPPLTTDLVAGFGTLGRALSCVGSNQRLVLEERPDDDRVHLARRAAIQAALAGRTVLLHMPQLDCEAIAQSLVALLSGVADPANTKHPLSVRRAVVRAEVLLGISPLYLSDAPVPITHAGGIAREVERRYGRPVDLVVTEGPVLDRPLDTCPLDVGAAFIASTPPAGLLAAASCDDRAWVFARRDSRMWVRRMRGDWSEVEGPGARLPDAQLLPLMRDETGAAIGWRLWNVRYGVGGAPSLASPIKVTPWPRGVLTSSCVTCGNCPRAGCTCGIYAHISPEDVVMTWRQHTDLVAGKVRAWGTVIRHIDGFRAQHAQIDTLYVSSSITTVGDELGRRYDCSIGPW